MRLDLFTNSISTTSMDTPVEIANRISAPAMESEIFFSTAISLQTVYN